MKVLPRVMRPHCSPLRKALRRRTCPQASARRRDTLPQLNAGTSVSSRDPLLTTTIQKCDEALALTGFLVKQLREHDIVPTVSQARCPC